RAGGRRHARAAQAPGDAAPARERDAARSPEGARRVDRDVEPRLAEAGRPHRGRCAGPGGRGGDAMIQALRLALVAIALVCSALAPSSATSATASAPATK